MNIGQDVGLLGNPPFSGKAARAPQTTDDQILRFSVCGPCQEALFRYTISVTGRPYTVDMGQHNPATCPLCLSAGVPHVYGDGRDVP